MGLSHTDLKPENILFNEWSKPDTPPKVRVRVRG
jgi:serine/threonine protein kinase